MPAPPVDYLPFSSLQGDYDDFLGFDEDENEEESLRSLDPGEEDEIRGIVGRFQKGLEEMKGSLKVRGRERWAHPPRAHPFRPN
jgi:hypothetical protein